ncbi:MAG: BrnT family toxin [Pseudomonadota bacterium]
MSKDRLNQRKHSVSFEEEKSLFYDDLAVQFFDDSHSLQEDRFLMLGMSSQSKLLLVCHCVRESDIIRIISARKTTKQESKLYPGGA